MGNGKEWTDEEVQKEIADAVHIVRSDRFEKDIRSRLAPPDPNKNDPPNAPPNSGGNDPQTQPKKKSLFWGTDPE